MAIAVTLGKDSPRSSQSTGVETTNGGSYHSVNYSEAPDRGYQQTPGEAPEAREAQVAEAPDAGEGRMSVLEHEFTHGRSQS